MEQKTLKYLRILIPGLVILLGLYPIIEYRYSQVFDIKTLDTAYITFIAILFGGIYYQLNIQKIIIKPSLYFIHENILNKLIQASSLTINEKEKEKLKKHCDNDRDDSFYMIVFYDIVDNDNSLKRKGENVRFNGIFWTSTADIFLTNVTFKLIYLYFYQNIPNYHTYQKLFTLFTLLGLVLHLISVFKHIDLSNKQLNTIIKNKELSTKVKNKFSEFIKSK